MFLAVVLVMGLVCTAHAKTYERCDLANELVRLGLTTRAGAGDWICLVQHESSFRTEAKGGPNGNGSYDHGLFQINGRYWCDNGGPHNDCGVSCSKLRDDDIADDVKCVKMIYKRHGFFAWYGWVNKCGGDSTSYVKDCWD